LPRKERRRAVDGEGEGGAGERLHFHPTGRGRNKWQKPGKKKNGIAKSRKEKKREGATKVHPRRVDRKKFTGTERESI